MAAEHDVSLGGATACEPVAAQGEGCFTVERDRSNASVGLRSFASDVRKRRVVLERKTNGGRLVWMRAPDLVRFGLSLERANVAYAHRGAVDWGRLFDAGNVKWPHFEQALDRLRRFGYSFGNM